jgi:hypothetical protein
MWSGTEIVEIKVINCDIIGDLCSSWQFTSFTVHQLDSSQFYSSGDGEQPRLTGDELDGIQFFQ